MPAVRARRRSADERGATLVELIVAIAISGIIIAAITNAIFVGFRTTDKVSARLADSHDTQLVATYFPNDVASTQSADVSLVSTATPSGCSGFGAGGSNVVLLPYAPRPDGTDPVTVTYRREGTSLVRYRCGSSGTASAVTVATGVRSASAATSTAGSGTTEQRTTTITVVGTSGRTFQVSGHPRTPKDVPDIATTAPPTTAAPLPCKVLSSSAAPASVALVAANPDTHTLSADVTVTIQTEGECVAPLRVTFQPGSGTDPTAAADLTSSGTGYTATLGATAHTWKAGAKPLQVSQAGSAVPGAVPSFTVTPAPCTVTTPPTVAPNPVALAASPAGSLQNPLVVSLTTAGSCTALQLRYTPATTAAPARPLTPGASGTWSTTIGVSDHIWTAGTKTMTVEQAPLAAITGPTIVSLVVNPAPTTPCTVVSALGLSPNPVTLASRNSGKLNGPVAVQVTTSGTCSGLSVSYSNGTNTHTTLLTASGSLWSGSIPKEFSGNDKWLAGNHVVTLLGTATNPAPTATLQVTG